MEKRKLSIEEIEDIISVIKLNEFNYFDIETCLNENIKNNLRKQLNNVLVYPDIIPQLKEIIIKNYYKSLIHPGEMVGTIAASSIGANTTQESLNSVDWDTRVLINKNGRTVEDCIGKIIDSELSENGYKTVIYKGQIDENLKNGNNPYAQVLDISSKNWYIPSIDENGNSCWKKITQLIRHPLYTGLIKVKTKKGRIVKATTGLSFLVKRDNKIIPINGCELTLEDSLPIVWKLPKITNTKTHLHLKDYLSPKKYIYGSDLWKAKEIRDEYILKGNQRSPWWKKHNDIDFQLPFKRGDTAMESIEGVGKSKIGKEDILKGYVYNYIRSSAKNLIPEYILLDEEFGFFIGAYLADGCSSDNYIAISKYDKIYLSRIETLAEKWGIKTHYTKVGYKYKHMNNYELKKGREVSDYAKNMEMNEGNADIRLHSTLINTLISELCGKGSLNKHIPDFAYNAPNDFIKGMLDGLFSGDGTISEDDIVYSSISERLIDGIITLLSTLNIFTTKSETIITKNNKDSKNINNVYTLRIGSRNVNRFIDFIKTLTIEQKNSKLQEHLTKIKQYNICKEEKKQLFNDVIMDKIDSIENIETNTFVYDFTVEDTKNFIIQNNLAVRDSFHSSGLFKANLVGGLQRQQELLAASKNVKTPSCNIYLTSNVNTKELFDVMEFCNSEIIYHDLEMILDNYTIDLNPELSEEEKLYYDFYSTIYNQKINEGNNYRVRLYFNKFKIYKIKKDLEFITKSIYLCLDKNKENLIIVYFPTQCLIIDIWILDTSSVSDVNLIIKNLTKKRANIKVNDNVKQKVKDILIPTTQNNTLVLKYINNVLIPSLLKIPVSGMFGIDECYYSNDKSKEWYIDTKGSNLKELIVHPHIDFKRTTSNNMHDIFNIYGIEATNSFLHTEFGKMIKVSKRHLTLLLDTMTFSGKISSVSRYGIDRKQVGPLAKACFEQPVENFLISATKGETDKLVGVTSNVCMGKMNKMGTGMFDLFFDSTKNDRVLSKQLKELKNKDKINSIKLMVSKNDKQRENLNSEVIEENNDYLI